MNLIISNPVTSEVVQWDTKIYGPDIGQLKAQRTRRRQNPVLNTSIDIPHELLEVQREFTIAMDGLTINGLKFLSTISFHIYFSTMNYIPNTMTGNYQRVLNKLNSVYKIGGFY